MPITFRVGIAAAAILVAGGCSTSTSTAGAPSPSSTLAVPPSAKPTTAAANPNGPGRMLCKVTDSGVYYLWVTSADHNFDACAGSPMQPITLDQLLAEPNMDRRCILGDAYTATHHAIVGVYSDTAAADLAAARAFCAANGGTN
jgi:hypothetical protein